MRERQKQAADQNGASLTKDDWEQGWVVLHHVSPALQEKVRTPGGRKDIRSRRSYSARQERRYAVKHAKN